MKKLNYLNKERVSSHKEKQQKIRKSRNSAMRKQSEDGNTMKSLRQKLKIIKDGPKETNIGFKSWILERSWASCWHPKSVTK